MKAVRLVGLAWLALVLNGCFPPAPDDGVCGDDDVNTVAGEECDDGSENSNSKPNACRTDCKNAWCGDGVKDDDEECDNGSQNSNTLANACREDCTEPRCGDDVKDDGEQCDDGNSADDDGCDGGCDLEPGWAWVPGGTYMMGCSPGDDDCSSGRDKPPHEVTVSPFLMMTTEITQEHYQSVIGSNPSDHTGCPTCPVEKIAWQEAKAFCAALGARLPSEAEWEYAARGGTTTRRYCDETVDADCVDSIAWHRENSDTGNGVQTHPVGEKTPNAYELYDMLGNVWEWSEDCWHHTYDGAPSEGGVWAGGDCSFRVLRGGSWGGFASHSRASYRVARPPGSWYQGFGGRCAR